jgi:hypothetical protein
MDWLWAIAVLATALIVPAFIPQAKAGKNKRALSSAFSVFDEIFHPSAKQAQQVVEEQVQAVKPMPTPEDKPL